MKVKGHCTGGPNQRVISKTNNDTKKYGRSNLNVTTTKRDVINSFCILSKINAVYSWMEIYPPLPNIF